jgi:DNA-binding transcriptional ArsR family regulator
MTKDHTILSKIPAEVRDSLTARSTEIWTFIYNYIEEHHYADCVDEHFTGEVCSRFDISPRTISSHLRRMRRVGLLHAWEGTLGRGQSSPYLAMFLGVPPSRIMRYTLPGQKPPRELYRQRQRG